MKFNRQQFIDFANFYDKQKPDSQYLDPGHFYDKLACFFGEEEPIDSLPKEYKIPEKPIVGRNSKKEAEQPKVQPTQLLPKLPKAQPRKEYTLATDKQVKDTFLKYKDFPRRNILPNVISDLLNRDLALTINMVHEAQAKVFGVNCQFTYLSIRSNLDAQGVRNGKVVDKGQGASRIRFTKGQN